MIKSQTQKSVAKLTENMYELWDQEIILNKKLEIFNMVKESHDPDFYINGIEDRYSRKYLAMLRLSTHPLKIEIGRYHNISRQNRTCDYCNLNDIENEIHFMTCCTLYSNIRNKLYQELNGIGNSNWLSCDSDEKILCYLLQPRDIQTAKLVIAYIKSCLETRKKQLQITFPV